MSPQPTLSICIATRNRAEYLAETLDSVLPQLGPQIELLVVDGASSDATPELMAAILARTSGVRYERLAKNGGFDRDYDRAVRAARGAYCWLMTDDDLVRPGAIGRILAALEDRPSLLVLNAEDRTVDMREVLTPQRVPGSDRDYAPEDEALLAELGHLLSFIGVTVIERAVWLARNPNPYLGCDFIHVGQIFQRQLPRFTRFLAEPAVSGRIGNVSYTARKFEIWMIKWPKLIWSFERYSRAARARVVLEAPWADPRALFVARGEGHYTLDAFKRWVAPRSAPAWRKLLAMLIMAVPARLAWLVMGWYWRITGNKSATTLYDWRFAPPAGGHPQA